MSSLTECFHFEITHSTCSKQSVKVEKYLWQLAFRGNHLKLANMAKLSRCLHGGKKILVLGRSKKAEQLFVCFTCSNFSRSGCQDPSARAECKFLHVN